MCKESERERGGGEINVRESIFSYCSPTHLHVPLSFILYEVLDGLSGRGHQTGALLHKLKKQPVHVAVGSQRPQGISTLISIHKTVLIINNNYRGAVVPTAYLTAKWQRTLGKKSKTMDSSNS
jgi:hypothetical protein